MLRRLEKKLGFLAVPHLTAILCIGQAATWLIMLSQPNLATLLPFVADKVLAGEVWRIITFAIIPKVMNPLFLFFALYLFWLMGEALEGEWGAFRYNVYLLTGFVLAIAGAFVQPGSAATNIGVLTSVFLAFAYLYPDFTIMLFFIIPVKIKYLGMLAGGLILLAFLQGIASRQWIDSAMALASIANFLLFFGPDIVSRLRHKQRGLARRSEQARLAEEPMHRCVVCGRTERSHPRLEFRYFPTPQGTQCYCQDHFPSAVPGHQR